MIINEEIQREIEGLFKQVNPNWTLNESSQAMIRLKVKKILRKDAYPEDKIEKAIEKILKDKALNGKW